MGGFVGGIESKGPKNSVCVSQFGKTFLVLRTSKFDYPFCVYISFNH